MVELHVTMDYLIEDLHQVPENYPEAMVEAKEAVSLILVHLRALILPVNQFHLVLIWDHSSAIIANRLVWKSGATVL